MCAFFLEVAVAIKQTKRFAMRMNAYTARAMVNLPRALQIAARKPHLHHSACHDDELVAKRLISFFCLFSLAETH